MFSQKIREVNQTIARQQQSFITVAKVLEADELNNVCTLQFTNNQGKRITAKGVPYQITDPKTMGFFPSKNDLVYMQSHDNKNYLIIGPYYKYDNIERNSFYQTNNNNLFMKDHGIVEGNIL